VRRHLAGIGLAREKLLFSARTGLRDGIRKLLEHLRAQGVPPAELLRQLEEVNWKKAA
jgi:hypothetical protein